MKNLQIMITRDEDGWLESFRAVRRVSNEEARAYAIDAQGRLHDAPVGVPVTLWMEAVGVGGRTREEAAMARFPVIDEDDGVVELEKAHVNELVKLGWARKCKEEPVHYHLNKGHTLDEVAKKFGMEETTGALLRKFTGVFAKHSQAIRHGKVPAEMTDLLGQFEAKQPVTSVDQDLLSAMGGMAALTTLDPLKAIHALPAIAALASMAMLEMARLKRRVAELETRQ